MDKIDYNKVIGPLIDITEFNGYKIYLVLELVRKHIGVKNFKNISMLEK